MTEQKKSEKTLKQTKEKKIRIGDISIPNYFEEEIEQTYQTGITPIDVILEGGITPGILQLVGESSTGKTFLATQISYNFCKSGKNVLYIDTKGDINSKLMKIMNLEAYNNSRFYYLRESSFSLVEKQIEKFISTGELSLIVIDSISGLINGRYLSLNDKTSISSDNNNTNYDTRPLILFIRKIKKLSLKYNIRILLTNDFSNKVEIYGNRGTVRRIKGPKCLQYESNYILQINSSSNNDKFKEFKRRFEPLEKENKVQILELEVIKSNKTTPHLKLPYVLEYGKGYSDLYPHILWLINMERIKQDKTYFSIGDKKFNGMLNLINYIHQICQNCSNSNEQSNSKSKEYYQSILDN